VPVFASTLAKTCCKRLLSNRLRIVISAWRVVRCGSRASISRRFLVALTRSRRSFRARVRPIHPRRDEFELLDVLILFPGRVIGESRGGGTGSACIRTTLASRCPGWRETARVVKGARIAPEAVVSPSLARRGWISRRNGRRQPFPRGAAFVERVLEARRLPACGRPSS